MVISIVTENADTYQGTGVVTKLGAVEEFQSVEVKHGMQLSNGAGLYGYLGVSEYPGADHEDAPGFFGRTWSVDWDGTGAKTYGPNDEVEEGLGRFNQAYRDRPKWKGHLEYTQGGLDVWFRHTSGGEYFTNPFSEDECAGYDQDTIYGKYKQEISDQLFVTYALSFDLTSTEEPLSTMYRKQYEEREYLGRILAQWTPSADHSVALGGEWSYEEFGLEHEGEATHTSLPIPDSWNTNMASVFGEHKWQVMDQWTLFLGGRLDKHTNTDTLFSPRGTLIHTPTKRDTIKLIAARSVRTNLAYWIREEQITEGGKSTPETLKSLELRYERLLNENAWLGMGAFYHDHDLIEWHWNPQIWRQTVIGNVKSYGLEAEASFKGKRSRLDLSHTYTKMLDYDLNPDPLNASQLPYQRHSAAPYGYGDDFASWSNHLTKLVVHHDITESWATDMSLYTYWGYPGREDFVDYREADTGATESYAHDDAFSPSVFLNLGVEYKPRKNMTLRVDGHNLLGWIDPQFNKRQQLAHRWVPGFYRQQPVAVTVSLRYQF